MISSLPDDADVLASIERFCVEHQMAPSTFGRSAIGDGSLVENLKGGRTLTLKVANRIVRFMAEYRAANSKVAA